MMRAQRHKPKGRGDVFELKHKVISSLNKLADRDTYQLGLQDLNSIVQSLNPEGVSPFLSCILHSDADQKNTVRKECVRLMGHLASLHALCVVPHLGKIVSSIVKRLKDPDSVVRDACVETMGIIASKFANHEHGNGVFVFLMKPLFEALGEQNKQLQSGSAFCLSKVIDCSHNPPLPILQQILNRTIKLLRSSHFVAKPAVIELITSIIKAGGAPSHTLLSAAMHSLQEALKSSDWNTRKAASTALGDIASSDHPLLKYFRASCIHGLESCRFDKVKPVRETVLQALKRWQHLPGSLTPEHPQTGSSFRGNSLCEDGDVNSFGPLGDKDSFIRRAAEDSSKTKFALSDRVTCKNFEDKPQHFQWNSWQSKMGVSKSPYAPPAEIQSERSVNSSTSNVFKGTNGKSFEQMAADVMCKPYAGNRCEPRDEQCVFISTSDVVDEYCKRKLGPELDGLCRKNALEISAESSPQSAIEEVSSEEQRHLNKLQNRNSFYCTSTNSSSHAPLCCCKQTANVLVSIKKQLFEIENKQSSIVDMLQVLTASTTNSLTMTLSKVVAIGNAVDQMADSILHGGSCLNKSKTRFPTRAYGLMSPGHSSFTPSPSNGINGELLSWSSNNVAMWEEKECTDSSKLGMSMWAGSSGYISKNPNANISNMKFMHGKETLDNGQNREHYSFPATVLRGPATECEPQDKDSNWKRVKGFIIEGDLESAFSEALCSEDELLLVELLNQGSPALDHITRHTANNLLTALASDLYHKKNIQTIIPWIQQIIDLSSTHGLNYLSLSSKLKEELLMAVQEAASTTVASPLQKKSLSQLNTRLHLLWGKSI